MANKEIAELDAGTALDGAELFHGVQGNNSRKFTTLQLLTPALAAGDQAAVRSSFGSALRGHLFGLTLANNATDATNDIDIAAGEAASEQTSPLLMPYAGTTGVQLDVAYGTGSGGRFDTSISDGTWHVFIISNGTTVGRGLSKSLDPTGQANYPSGYTHYRRIGSVLREAGALIGFAQVGDEFIRSVAVLDVDADNPGTSAVTRALSVPTGVKVRARMNAGLRAQSSSNIAVHISCLDASDQAPSITVAPLSFLPVRGAVAVNVFSQIEVMTNTSAQIRSRLSVSVGGDRLAIATLGWLDTRGRLG